MAIYYGTHELPHFRNTVVTIGTFDGVHLGHQVILQELVKQAQAVDGESVVITFEPHPRKFLRPDEPIKILTPLQEKLALLTAAGVQHVVVVPFDAAFASLSASQYLSDFLVDTFHPHTIVIGYDHHFGQDRTGNIELLKQYQQQWGYKLYEIPARLIEAAAISSTKIRHALQAGMVGDAAGMLGRAYSLSGAVQQGAQLGRTLGYPTANILPRDADQLVPAHGVYAVYINWKGKRYPAMLNIGIRPTVSKDLTLHIEAHLFDFNEDLYGQQLEIIFIARLRNEQKFDGLDALKAQLARDKVAAIQALTA